MTLRMERALVQSTFIDGMERDWLRKRGSVRAIHSLGPSETLFLSAEGLFWSELGLRALWIWGQHTFSNSTELTGTLGKS